MAVSQTTFAERMKKINSGQTTSWTVPGEGLAEVQDERRFLSKAGVKVREKSTRRKGGRLVYVLALLAGALSVIAARWLDFTFLDTALAFAAERGLDAAAFVAGVPTALILAVVISLFALLLMGLRKSALPFQAAGFAGAFVFEAELVALAPHIYAKFYPEPWVADMMSSATLLS